MAWTKEPSDWTSDQGTTHEVYTEVISPSETATYINLKKQGFHRTFNTSSWKKIRIGCCLYFPSFSSTISNPINYIGMYNSAGNVPGLESYNGILDFAGISFDGTMTSNSSPDYVTIPFKYSTIKNSEVLTQSTSSSIYVPRSTWDGAQERVVPFMIDIEEDTVDVSIKMASINMTTTDWISESIGGVWYEYYYAFVNEVSNDLDMSNYHSMSIYNSNTDIHNTIPISNLDSILFYYGGEGNGGMSVGNINIARITLA